MRVDEFDFDLPEDRIALRPVEPKHNAKMLVVNPNQNSLTDFHVYDLPDLLTPNDILVFNDTKVIPAQLYGEQAGKIFEINLHKRLGPIEWLAFAKKTRKLKSSDVLSFGAGRLHATILDKSETDGVGQLHLKFDCKIGELENLLVEIGLMPLPPYIASKRKIDEKDTSDYQTIFAKKEGAVAAPTASLHYTPELLQKLDEKKIPCVTLTLHVGAGTFLPVKAADTKDHKMHAEWGEITQGTAKILNEVRARGGRIVAVGTTVMRLLESAADEKGIIHPFSGDTDIFITPGYKFRAVDALQTNFHLPKSTLFMLVSAFSGLNTMRTAYSHAIETGYRFYSYGDSSLLLKQN
jgi:S-adenosylmethionine:tRNA ribosyltransferase-isomerase